MSIKKVMSLSKSNTPAPTHGDFMCIETRPRVNSCAQSQIKKMTHLLTLLTPEGHVQIKPIIIIFQIVFRELFARIVKLTQHLTH